MSTPAQQADSTDESVPDHQPAAFDAEVDRSVLQSWLEAIMAVHDEGIVTVSTTGLRVNMIGPANVGGVDANLKVSGFEKLTVQKGGEIGVEFGKFDDVLSSMSASDTVRLTITETHCLRIVSDTSHYDMALVDKKNLEDNRHDVGFDGQDSVAVTIKPSELDDGFNLVGIADDLCKMSYDPDNEEFSIKAKSDTDDTEKSYDSRHYEQITQSPAAGSDSSITDSFGSIFKVDYCKNQLAPTSSEPISVLIADDYPTIWNYTLEDCITVSALIAPRLPSESDRLN